MPDKLLSATYIQGLGARSARQIHVTMGVFLPYGVEPGLRDNGALEGHWQPRDYPHVKVYLGNLSTATTRVTIVRITMTNPQKGKRAIKTNSKIYRTHLRHALWSCRTSS